MRFPGDRLKLPQFPRAIKVHDMDDVFGPKDQIDRLIDQPGRVEVGVVGADGPLVAGPEPARPTSLHDGHLDVADASRTIGQNDRQGRKYTYYRENDRRMSGL